jgi:hypothetical protein
VEDLDRAVSPWAARLSANSTSGGYSLQHDKGLKRDSRDLGVLVSQCGPGCSWWGIAATCTEEGKKPAHKGLQSKAGVTMLSKTDPTWPSGQLLDMQRIQAVRTHKLTSTTLITFKQVLPMFKVIRIIGLQPILSMQLWSINIDIKQLIDCQSSQHHSHTYSKSKHYESFITTFCHNDEAITQIWECHKDSNRYTPCKVKSDNMTYAWSLGPYIRQPFTKSLRGQIHSSTPGMKSWLLSDRLVLPSSWLPPTTTLE